MPYGDFRLERLKIKFETEIHQSIELIWERREREKWREERE